jgi:hypothetical protein
MIERGRGHGAPPSFLFSDLDFCVRGGLRKKHRPKRAEDEGEEDAEEFSLCVLSFSYCVPCVNLP